MIMLIQDATGRITPVEGYAAEVKEQVGHIVGTEGAMGTLSDMLV